MWLYLARRSLSASYGPRNRTVSHSRTIFILSSRRCSSFHDYYLAERRRDDKRFVETVSLSLSFEASSWRKLGHFIEDKATSSGLKFTQASIPPSSGFFSFSAENPTKTLTLNQSTLSLSRFIAWLIFRDGFISLKIFATRHCSTIELIPGNGRDFFLIWRLLDSNIESISDSFTGSIPLLRFIEAWLIHRMNSSSLTFMLIAGNARDFCRCVSLSFR